MICWRRIVTTTLRRMMLLLPMIIIVMVILFFFCCSIWTLIKVCQPYAPPFHSILPPSISGIQHSPPSSLCLLRDLCSLGPYTYISPRQCAADVWKWGGEKGVESIYQLDMHSVCPILDSPPPPFSKLAPLQSAVFSATVPGTSVFSAKWVPFAVPIVGNLFGIFGLFVLYMVTQFLAACFPTGSCHLVQTLSELRGGTLEILRLS